MGQPKKSFVNLDFDFSKELTHLLDYINSDFISGSGVITPEMFVCASLEKENTTLYKAVNAFLNSDEILEIHDELIMLKDDNITIDTTKNISFSPKLLSIFQKANNELINTNSTLINTDHVLMVILNDEENVITKLFNKHGLTYTIYKNICKDIHDVFNDVIKNDSNNDTIIKKITIIDDGNFADNDVKDLLSTVFSASGKAHKQNNNKTNTKGIPYCINLNELAKKGKIDKLIGRTDELNEIMRILGRRKTNNVILVGEVGVGKSQIVNGLAELFMSNTQPIMFRGKELWKFNPTEIIAGTTLRGMFEERVLSMTKALKNNKNAILVIDDMHTIFSDKGKSDYDSGGSISDIFNNDDIQVIAITNYKGYKHMCDTNGDILKKFQKVDISKTNDEDSFNILLGNKEYYEKYHNVYYSDEIIRECISLSKRYITDKTLPSSAIDILDELGSYKKMHNDNVIEISNIQKEINNVDKTIYEKIGNEDSEIDKYEKECDSLKNKLSIVEGKYRSQNKLNITMDDLYYTISKHTNIPISNLKSDDKKALSNIDKKLKNIIIGQDDAIDSITKSIKRNKVGLSLDNKPLGSFMMVGTSGVGKTLLAKTLAKEIFGDEKYLIRFDMSEYVDKTSVNKLIGASAGYVGYTEGGLLTEAVKRNKYAVLLIDEIEKANEDIYNLFLQIFDEGFITDNVGEKVDFKNTIIILTSNVGTKKASQQRSFGFDSDDNINKKSIIEKELKDKFPPEFINRLDEIIYFNNLTDDNIRQIVTLDIKNLIMRMNKLNYSVSYTDDVIDVLFKLSIKDKEYGARPIKRIIKSYIEDKITDLIITSEVDITNFKIEVIDNEIVIN